MNASLWAWPGARSGVTAEDATIDGVAGGKEWAPSHFFGQVFDGALRTVRHTAMRMVDADPESVEAQLWAGQIECLDCGTARTWHRRQRPLYPPLPTPWTSAAARTRAVDFIALGTLVVTVAYSGLLNALVTAIRSWRGAVSSSMVTCWS